MSILTGIKDILTSLSGTFSLITLAVLGIVTWHAPVIGAMALAAFATATPAILAVLEHREEMAKNKGPYGQ